MHYSLLNISYKPIPDPLQIEALSWEKYLFYWFPPFSCISRCLQKVQEGKAKGAIVMPHWPT